jgi:hypothetical protein
MKCRNSVQNEAVPVHTMTAYGGRIGIAQLILYFDTTLRAVMNIMLRPHYPLGEKSVVVIQI